MPDLVERMLTASDNDLAEALGRHVAIAAGLPATFAGEAAATVAALEPLLSGLGVPGSALSLRDASGLSPLNRVQPAALARLLALAARDERFGAVLSGLPVAGFDGTLEDRYREGPTAVAAGQVRAKTGTLTGVSALAGVVRTRDGRLLAFDITADAVPQKGSADGAGGAGRGGRGARRLWLPLSRRNLERWESSTPIWPRRSPDGWRLPVRSWRSARPRTSS